MSAVFRPGQRVRCVREDSYGSLVVKPGEVLVVGKPFDDRLFSAADGTLWFRNRFTPTDQPGPWTDHDGGACPAGLGVRVEVRWRYGTERAPASADALRWKHSGGDNDIVAYRLAADPPDADHPPAEPDRLANGIAAIKAEVERMKDVQTETAVTFRRGLIGALHYLGISTTIHPPQPARVEFTEQNP